MKLSALIRINIRQLSFVLVSFLLMVIISCVFINRIVNNEIAVAAQEMLSRAEAGITAILREGEVSALNLSVAIQDRIDSGLPLEQLEPYMMKLNREMVYPDEKVTGLMFMGGLIAGEFRVGMEWTPPVGYAPEERPWYKAARAAGRHIAFTGPYIDARTGGRVVSFSRNLTGMDGADYGVLFLDMSVEVLSDNIASLELENGGYGMLIDAGGNVITHPDGNLAGEPLSAASEGYAKIAERIRAGDTFIPATQLINFSGARVVTFFQKMSNGWYIAIAFPIARYYHDVYLMIAMLAVLGTVMMIVLSYFLLRLSMEKMHSDEESTDKSSFLARMSHEIRTPLNSILGMSELILRKDVTRDVFEHVSIIRQAGNNLLAIVNDILDFSKIEAGQLEISHEKYSFASLINDVVNVIRVRLIDRPIAFSVKVDANIPDCLIGDEARVRQILLNLLSNSVKYTRTGHIALKVVMEDVGDENIRLICSVEDSGVGIKEENMCKLFRDFTRIETLPGGDVEGTGLGLVISRNLCLSMGGDISVVSEYGRGSTFTANVLQIRGGGGRLASVDGASEKRVLVFEERPIYLDSLVYALTGLGVNPVYARSRAEFNRALEDGGCDYAFVSSKYAADCMFTLGKSKSPTQLVSMIELGEVSAYRGAHSIMIPIYCTEVANVLNNTADAEFSADSMGIVHFMAPDIRVLIVDDISTNLRVSKELMALYGLDIHTCLSGFEAIELARVNRYDIIFMDHMMPDMDGVEAAAAIRAIDGNDPYYQNIPIIALTANAVSGQREMFLQNGMNGFLAKPIEMKKLDAVLKEWIPEEKRLGTASAENALPETEQLGFFEIKGVSIEMGLRNSGGSVAAYADILMDFRRDADERAEQIEQCLANGDIDLYRTLVHALKGAARSIGAEDFGSLAAEMEEAARIGNTDVCAKKTGDMLAALRTLTGEIRKALDNRFEGGKARTLEDISVARLKTLRSALADMDIATVNELMLAYVDVPLEPKSKEALSEIERLILIFEYNEAIEKINLLIDAVTKGDESSVT